MGPRRGLLRETRTRIVVATGGTLQHILAVRRGRSEQPPRHAHVKNRARQNGSFEKNGRQASYPTHHADPLRAEANDRTSAPRTRVPVHTNHMAGRMRTRAAFRTIPAQCNTCAHFCKLGTQSVSLLFSTQPAPCTSCTPPTALAVLPSEAEAKGVTAEGATAEGATAEGATAVCDHSSASVAPSLGEGEWRGKCVRRKSRCEGEEGG